MNFLVTGGAGFIGSHLATSLVRDGHEVTILDDLNDFYSRDLKLANLKAVGEHRFFQADLRDRERVRECVREGHFDSVVHLAARAGVRPSIQDPELYLSTNITGTFHLLEAMREAGMKRLVFASSSSVYGVIQETPFHEKMCLDRTISPYAATKLAGEQLCANYAHLHGIDTVCLRFFTVYGPRQRPDLAIHQFVRRIHQGEAIRQFGDGSSRRDYTYVEDIVQGVRAAMDYVGSPFEIFNLGESETTSLSELIQMIERAMDKKAVIELLPEQPGDVPVTFADISKARKMLGYRPSTPISEGIPKFVDWFLHEGAGL